MDDTSVVKVFGCTELLESILLASPIRTVLTAQRVSKRFRDTVESSPNLQRHLFFAPTSTELLFDPEDHPNSSPHPRTNTLDMILGKGLFPGRRPVYTSSGHQFKVNPVLSHILPLCRHCAAAQHPNVPCFPGLELMLIPDGSYRRASFSDMTEVKALTHPLLADGSTKDHCAYVYLQFRIPNDLDMDRKPVNYPEASWRRMYLTQPPTRGLLSKLEAIRGRFAMLRRFNHGTEMLSNINNSEFGPFFRMVKVDPQGLSLACIETLKPLFEARPPSERQLLIGRVVLEKGEDEEKMESGKTTEGHSST